MTLVTMRRLSAFLVMLLVVSATVLADWQECFGWSSSAAAQHACCATMHEGRADAAKNCCAMAQQSRDRGATEARVGAPPSATAAIVNERPAAAFELLAASAVRNFSPPGHAVPLYVQHRALLI